MSASSAELPVLQPPLDAILRSEFELGNEIAEVQLGGWSEVDLVVSLKFPFRKDYQKEFENAEFYRNTDTHYPLSDSYTANREAVEAPY
ncbi:MAG TPA: hypothetical protein VNB22_00535 [Pyrinomonadaceae bacterium]|nr:hypothetical protein [Pyrinomonadaceae bacterium]